MSERRANPHGYSHTPQSRITEALMRIVAIGMSASFGTLVGHGIYLLFGGL